MKDFELKPDARKAMRIHDRWAQSIPSLKGQAAINYEEGMQCLHCRHYIALKGDMGSDWGVCSSWQSFFDGKLVFEHHSCPQYEDE